MIGKHDLNMSCPDESKEIDVLTGTPWTNWQREPLAGDASSRKYVRLRSADGDSAILMDNGAPDGNGFAAFCRISDHLRRIGLVSPEILHVSDNRRFAVISDLGEITLSARLDSAPHEARARYSELMEVLGRLAGHAPPEGLGRLTPAVGAAMLSPLFDHAAGNVGSTLRLEVESQLEEAMARHCSPPGTLSLRDFHTENVIWREATSVGTDRFGLLDFQDAFVTPPEYDLASLLRDVRRDVPEEVQNNTLKAFAAMRGDPLDDVAASCAVLAVQRNLRILGIFFRLIVDERKPRYATFLPRAVRLLREDLAHSALDQLRDPVSRILDNLPS